MGSADSIAAQPFVVLELKLSHCANIFGTAPCVATGEKCYNTRRTCKDVPNYSESTKSINLCSQVPNFPKGQNLIPCITNVDDAPTAITGGKGLGARAKITITIKDLPHNDQGIDPYVDERSYDKSQGSLIGKMLYRNPYYQGREGIVKHGNLTSPFNINDLTPQHYIIEKISNPDNNDVVKIVVTDVLNKIDNKRAQWPPQSSGELSVIALIGDTTITLKSGQGVDYVINEHVAIASEVMLVTGIAGDVLDVTRSQWNTVAIEHKVDSKVQLCKTYNSVNIVDILKELLTVPANIPTNYIIDADWNEEKTEWVPNHNFSALLHKPYGVETLVIELLRLGLLDMWVDEEAQTIRLKASSPYRVEPLVIDDNMVLDNLLKVSDKPDKRLSRVWVKYGLLNPIQGEEDANVKRGYALSDSIKESGELYGEIRAEVITTRWLRDTSNDRDHAFSLVQRLISRYGETPKEFEFNMPSNSKSLPKTGDVIRIKTIKNQDATGAALIKIAQIMRSTPNRKGGQINYLALAYNSALSAGEEVNQITLSTDQYNYNLWLAAGSPPEPITVDLIINSGVRIGSIDSTLASLVIGSFAVGSIINVTNVGVIMGAGGKGGDAGGRLTRRDYIQGEPQLPVIIQSQFSTPGEVGGVAIQGADGVTINITNTDGLIAGANGGIDGEYDSQSYRTFDNGPDDPVPTLSADGGDGGDGFNFGVAGVGYGAGVDGIAGTYNISTAGLGINAGAAIDAPNSTVNILAAGTINGAVNSL